MANVNFTGSPGRMIVSGYTGVSGNGPRAISFWYNSDSTAPFSKGSGNICYWGDAGSDPLEGTQWRINTKGSPAKIQVSARGSFRNSSKIIEDGNWHNVIINFPGGEGTNASDCNIYIDGVLDNDGQKYPPDESVLSYPEVNTTAGTEVIVGARVVGSGTVIGTGIPLTASGFASFFEGGIDSFAIWGEELTSDSISTITGSRGADLSVVQTGTLQVWLTMGDVGGDTAGAAGTIQDSGPFGRDAATTEGTTISG